MASSRDMCLYGSVVSISDVKAREDGSEGEEDDNNTKSSSSSTPSSTPSSSRSNASPARQGLQISPPPPPREKLQHRRRSRTKPPPICDECEAPTIIAEFYCLDCDLSYCRKCNEYRHRKGKLTLHRRSLISLHSPDTSSLNPAPVTSVDSIESSSVDDSETFRSSKTLLHPDQWEVKQVTNWLKSINLEQYTQIFEAQRVSGYSLLSLDTEEKLESKINITMRVHRRKMLREIQKLKAMEPLSLLKPDVLSPRDGDDCSSTRHSSPVAARNARIRQGKTDTDVGRRVRTSIRTNQLSPTPLSGLVENEKVFKAAMPMRDEPSYTKFKPLDLKLQLSKDAIHPASGKKKYMTSGIDKANGEKRMPKLSGLALDLDKVSTDRSILGESFNFSAEGTLLTQGFEINTDGISIAPFEASAKQNKLCTKDYLLILNELGQGAGGKVYKALYVPTFKFVAVKVVRLYDSNKRRQMVRELKSLYENSASIDDISQDSKKGICEELVAFYDAYTNPDKGTVSIVLEYMDKGSLEDLVQSKAAVDERALSNIAHDVLKGLAFLHDRHQLHRDIKPSNILRGESGKAKISDFGISRDLESTLAKATTFTGTLMYMAPERISGGTYSYPSDIWSFGLSLMTCAIGKLPLPANDGYWGVVHAVQQKASPCLSDYGSYSREFCEFIDLCLRKDPLMRPRASQLLQHPFILSHRRIETPCRVRRFDQINYVSAEAITKLQNIVGKLEGWEKSFGKKFSEIGLLCFEKKLAILSEQLHLPPKVVYEAFGATQIIL